jgi:phosphoribosylanthranilate isomerase
MARVKICGITRLEDAEHAVGKGAWALGFILWQDSPRACDPAMAAAIARRVRRRADLVGVFVNEPLDAISRTAEALQLTHVQLHGDEGPSFCAAVGQRTGVKVIKAARVRTAADVRDLERFRVDFHLLDAGAPGLRGGTGKTWDWGLAAARRSEVPLILSGGLNAENVDDGIATGRAVGRRRRLGRRGLARRQGSREAGGLHGRCRRGPGERMSVVEHRFGPYGGQYVPETLMPALGELEAAWTEARSDASYQDELGVLLRDFAGRATPLYHATGSRRASAATSTSSARTCSTRARTRSTTPWASACSRGAWASTGSSPKPARASTASRRPPRVRCSASSAWCTWARRTCAARSPTCSACGCSAPRVAPVEVGARRSRKRSRPPSATGWRASPRPTTSSAPASGPAPFPAMVRDLQR